MNVNFTDAERAAIHAAAALWADPDDDRPMMAHLERHVRLCRTQACTVISRGRLVFVVAYDDEAVEATAGWADPAGKP